MATAFALQFDPARIKSLAASFEFADNSAALEAGRLIQGGDYSPVHLQAICEWKSRRSSGRVRRNTLEEVEDALRLCVSASTDRSAVAVLIGLRGIDVAVASAVLSAVFPDRFTIIDFRALEALGVNRPSPPLDFYLEYLSHCRGLAAAHGVTLRELDQALWQWSKASFR